MARRVIIDRIAASLALSAAAVDPALSAMPVGASASAWAASQAAPRRRVIVNGSVAFQDYCAPNDFASGGFIADTAITGKLGFYGNQQYLVRNSDIGGVAGCPNGLWNMVYSGVKGAPAQVFTGQCQQNTLLRSSPVTEEEPFLYAGAGRGFRVFVPAARRGSSGPFGPIRSPALLALGHAGAATAANPDLISAAGIAVTGNDVTAYGLAVEHYQKSEVTWSGQGGTDVFFQNELPYVPPSQAAWRQSATRDGYPAFQVGAGVTTFRGYGMGNYVMFIDTSATRHDAAAFEAPKAPGIAFRGVFGVWIGGPGGLDSVINGVGGPVSSTRPGKAVPVDVASYHP